MWVHDKSDAPTDISRCFERWFCNMTCPLEKSDPLEGQTTDRDLVRWQLPWQRSRSFPEQRHMQRQMQCTAVKNTFFFGVSGFLHVKTHEQLRSSEVEKHHHQLWATDSDCKTFRLPWNHFKIIKIPWNHFKLPPKPYQNQEPTI